MRRAAGRWLRSYDASISDPNAQPESWNPSRQEYAFAPSAEVAEGPVVLAADEYRDGRVDWYSFRAASAPSLGNPTNAVAPTEVIVPPMLPVPVRYPGMPADRYWEFEDARVNLAELQAGRTDLVQIQTVHGRGSTRRRIGPASTSGSAIQRSAREVPARPPTESGRPRTRILGEKRPRRQVADAGRNG